jgi:hypothetical protein
VRLGIEYGGEPVAFGLNCRRKFGLGKCGQIVWVDAL